MKKADKTNVDNLLNEAYPDSKYGINIENTISIEAKDLEYASEMARLIIDVTAAQSGYRCSALETLIEC